MHPIDRRQFLQAISSGNGKKSVLGAYDRVFKKYANTVLPAANKTTAFLQQYTGPFSEVQIRHLLRRTMFGIKKADVDTLLSMSMSDAVDYLLNNTSSPNPPLNNYIAAGTEDETGVQAGDTWTTALLGDANLNETRKISYKAWWTGVILNQNLSIQEKMVFFWHNHFATETGVNCDARMTYQHNVLLRSNAIGNFKTLAKLVTKDACMLLYLNGSESISYRPDENYAREFQELFTLGKNNLQNYTEDDVKAAAKILTGWRVNPLTLGSFFLPSVHDTTDKQFSSFYNNRVIYGQAGAAGAAGANETDLMIDMIFAKTETAHYICTKLYRFFVYYSIDDNIDQNVIVPLAQLLIASDFEMKPVLSALLKSEHFYDANNMGCYIKTPLDFMGGVFRTFNIALPAGLTVIDEYAYNTYLCEYAANLGLDLGDPPNVAGWPAFYEAPVYHEVWMNSSTYPLRLAFTDMMLSSGLRAGTTISLTIDVIGFAKQCSNVGDPNVLVNYFVSVLLASGISADNMASLKTLLLSGQLSDHYWTEAWTNFIANPDATNTGIVSSRLTQLLTSMLRMPEYQLC